MPNQQDKRDSTPSGQALQIPINSDADIVIARQKVRELALQLDMSATDATLLATGISELARNIVLYARTGEIIARPITNAASQPGLLIIARDDGPGILNIQQAMQEGFSTSGSSGLGLPGVRRIMDDFAIESKPGRGTTVTVTKLKS